ncbi:MAG: DMT family transporter [Anaerolineae bacterium]|nr:DMT family transporter [Anaerolineae bacterium]
MPTLLLIIVFGLAGGIAVGLQTPMASTITERIGVMESAFIVHLGGAVAAGLILLVVQRGGKLADWHRLPWYTLGAGVLGLVVLSSVSYTIPRVGAVPTTMLIVAGQLVIGVLIDQFGLLGVDVRPVNLTRLAGIVVLCVGTWIVVRSA